MNLQQIEDEALHLSAEDRAELAQKLLSSLDAPGIEEIEQSWLLEAKHRAEQIDSGAVQPVPMEEVTKKARDLLTG